MSFFARVPGFPLSAVPRASDVLSTLDDAARQVTSGIEHGGRVIGDGLASGSQVIMIEPHLGSTSGDIIHDVFLLGAAAAWLGGRIPIECVRSLTNRGTTPQSRNQELYLGDGLNWISISKQALFSICGLSPLAPIPWFFSFVGAFRGISLKRTDTAPNPSRYPNESWYFINGIATDDNWLYKNLEYLESRFGQRITGISNGTCGLPTDLLACILNRNLRICTKSVRAVVNQINSNLKKNPDRRIRIMAHSQGTLILNLALNELFKTRPQDMPRLLIHTFAACAKDYPDHGYGLIEHYANENDGVSKLGVLDGTYRHRYQGTVYVHRGVGGHLLNTSYSLLSNDYTPVPDAHLHPHSLLALPGPLRN